MSLGTFRRRPIRRRWAFTSLAVAAVALAVVFVAGSSANLSGSSFEGNDGNLTVNTAGNTDWVNVAGLHKGVDLPSGTGDNSFGQGTKEDDAAVTVVSGSIPPNKSDLTRFYEASELVNNQVFVYLAWERTNNLGNANMDFEINQNSNGCPGTSAGKCTIQRTNGDVLVTYDFSGSGTPSLGVLRWLVAGQQNPDQTNHPGLNNAGECFSSNTLPCWGDHEALNSTNSEGQVDTGANGTTDPIPPNAPRTIVQNGFGEAAINLTGAGVITSSNGCQFGSATTFLKSRSSSSFTSEIKDFIAPTSTPLFSNCGAIKITKTSTKGGAALAGATFRITGPNSYDQSFTTDSNGLICVDSLAFGSYSITETAAPTGYAIDGTFPDSASVQSGGSCPSSPTVSKSYTDTPLTDITATATSEVTGAGATASTISCVDSSNGDVGNSPQGPAASPSVSANGLRPGTYTCTIVVDP
jgi:hypothetical protein